MEKECLTGENGSRTYYDTDNNILNDIIVGNMEEKNALDRINIIKNLTEETGAKINVLADLNKAKAPSSKARKLYLNFLNNYEKIGKQALYGAHPVARVIASFLIGATRNKNIKFFKNREDALEWLKED